MGLSLISYQNIFMCIYLIFTAITTYNLEEKNISYLIITCLLLLSSFINTVWLLGVSAFSTEGELTYYKQLKACSPVQ